MKDFRREGICLLIYLFFAALMKLDNFSGSLDTMFFYSAEEATNILENMGEIGRDHYFRHEIIDLFYLVSYSFLLFCLAEKLISFSKAEYIVLIPGFLDFVETTVIMANIKEFLIIDIPSWLGLVTALKWTLALSFFVSLGFLFFKRILFHK